jgi:hypothetical protein
VDFVTIRRIGREFLENRIGIEIRDRNRHRDAVKSGKRLIRRPIPLDVSYNPDSVESERLHPHETNG